MVKKISEKDFEQMDKNGVVILDFSASWCGPCQMLAPILEEVSEELKGKAAFYKIDVDESPELARTFSVQNIPTLVLLKDGVKTDLQIGFQPKENLMDFITKNM